MELSPELAKKIDDPNHPIFVVLDRLGKVEEKMKTLDPEISTHLKEIWKHMQQYEELAHLLSPEQIGILFRGLQKHTAIVLVTETPKKSGKAKKYSESDLV